MTATALWFGPAQRRCFGWLHLPQRVAGAPAVVLCPPLGRELINAHFSFRLLAEALERAGAIVVRFDYDGTGDSAGDGDDPNRLASWMQSIGHAAALARAQGAGSLSLVGLRMGALLAEIAARTLAPIDSLVLWDPCVTGRAFVRQQRALERLRLQAQPQTSAHDVSPGGLINAGTAELLKQLVAPDADTPVSERVLLLHRPEDTSTGTLLERLGDTPLACERIEGQPELIDVEPTVSVVPQATITRIVAWLAESLKLSPRLSPGQDNAAVAELSRTDWRHSPDAAVICEHGAAGAITERILKLGHEGLFGIETVPEQRNPSLPTVVFLNSGKDWHGGPSRMWVKMARSWATLGFRCVRFDLSGLGDSPVRPGQSPQVVRAAEAFDDVELVLDELLGEDRANAVLVGLCSGGYQALESALTVHPRGVMVINPTFAFRPPEAAGGRIDARRRICLPTKSGAVKTYRRLVFPSLRKLVRPLLWRARRTLSPGQADGRWINELAPAGTNVLWVCGTDELHQVPHVARQVDHSPVGGSLRIEAIATLDHGVIPSLDQNQVTELFMNFLTEHFQSDAQGVPDATFGISWNPDAGAAAEAVPG